MNCPAEIDKLKQAPVLLDRRNFIVKSSELLLFYTFYRAIHSSQSWAKPIEPIITKWVRGVNEICTSVRTGKLTPQEWQVAIESLHANIPVEDILKFIDFEKALKTLSYPKEKLATLYRLKWPEVEGFQAVPQVKEGSFVYRKGSCEPPHAHNHAVSFHLMIKGQMRVRTFDRTEDLDGSMLIRPVRDFTASAGSVVSMSDYAENVHWFEGVSDYSAEFGIIVLDVEANKKYRNSHTELLNQIFLDVPQKVQSDETLRAPIISYEQAKKLYA